MGDGRWARGYTSMRACREQLVAVAALAGIGSLGAGVPQRWSGLRFWRLHHQREQQRYLYGFEPNLLSSNLYAYAGTVCSDGTNAEITKTDKSPEIPEMKVSPLRQGFLKTHPVIGLQNLRTNQKPVQSNRERYSRIFKKSQTRKRPPVKIPDKVTLNGKAYKVTSVRQRAFQNYKNTKALWSKIVTAIGAKGFQRM